MGQARGSAIVATMLLLCIMQPSCEISDATNYTVGDDDGWNFKVHDWPTGKKFHAHDTLVFKYNNGHHNVALVDKNDYTTCTTGEGDQVFSSGNDEIKLQHGQNYICGFPGHRAARMKMAVTTTQGRS
ncbi:hypothetical protein ACE6H2_005577 [Prunus campanulata]